MRLFLDINVVLDVLADREPWVEHSAAVLSLLDAAEVEDAVQAISAQRAKADYIVTRNPSDFEAALVPVVTPKQLLATLASSTD